MPLERLRVSIPGFCQKLQTIDHHKTVGVTVGDLHRHGILDPVDSKGHAGPIPLALVEAIEDGRIKSGDLVLMEAIGGGFVWGSALARW